MEELHTVEEIQHFQDKKSFAFCLDSLENYSDGLACNFPEMTIGDSDKIGYFNSSILENCWLILTDLGRCHIFNALADFIA